MRKSLIFLALTGLLASLGVAGPVAPTLVISATVEGLDPAEIERRVQDLACSGCYVPLHPAEAWSEVDRVILVLDAWEDLEGASNLPADLFAVLPAKERRGVRAVQVNLGPEAAGHEILFYLFLPPLGMDRTEVAACVAKTFIELETSDWEALSLADRSLCGG
ncbi:hypothetical protein [Stagnihabitans tardus]|uniref:Uncharacterized protein n=1 Tax=Stagnihabitans tardus TaxID=2699202 RepID=A0AAE4Y8Q9_9RHOB|nr:hypothetical protein [Stagnihabitans tardus]NBZ87309.1 hypothetical protein [Stagnihabitans tardus]